MGVCIQNQNKATWRPMVQENQVSKHATTGIFGSYILRIADHLSTLGVPDTLITLSSIRHETSKIEFNRTHQINVEKVSDGYIVDDYIYSVFVFGESKEEVVSEYMEAFIFRYFLLKSAYTENDIDSESLKYYFKMKEVIKNAVE